MFFIIINPKTSFNTRQYAFEQREKQLNPQEQPTMKNKISLHP